MIQKPKPFTLPNLTNNLVKVQQKQQVGIFLVVVFFQVPQFLEQHL